jgi:hypothetical protein
MLTVNKVCQPANELGRFDLLINGTRFHDTACGGTTGPVTVAVGSHEVSERGGTATNLKEYTTAIGGDCTQDGPVSGSITLTEGQSATCTITNTLKPITITVDKKCMPANDTGPL